MELAKQRRKKALQVGDQTAADRETRTLAGHATDVPKGVTGGQKLGRQEQLSISTLKAFDASDYAALRGHIRDLKAGKGTPALLAKWRDAEADMSNARKAIADLAQFSKTGNSSGNIKITNAIKNVTIQLRILADIVGGV